MRSTPVAATVRLAVSLALCATPSLALAQVAYPPAGGAAPPVIAPARPAGPGVIAQPARPPVVVAPARPPVVIAPAQPARPPVVIAPAQPPAVAVPARPPVVAMPPPGFRVGVAPPPPRVEVRPARPGPAHVWVPGFWTWSGRRHEWVAGYWYMPPQPAVEWVPPRWELRGNAWVWAPGYWRNAMGATVVLPPPAPVYVTPAPLPYGPQTATPIAVSAIATGVLRAGAGYAPQGAFADEYSVVLSAGQTVTIVLRGGASLDDPSRTLDVYAAVIGNGQTLAADDNAAGYPNSRVVFTAPWSGAFVIRVTSAQPQRAGHYTLQTYPGVRPEQN